MTPTAIGTQIHAVADEADEAVAEYSAKPALLNALTAWKTPCHRAVPNGSRSRAGTGRSARRRRRLEADHHDERPAAARRARRRGPATARLGLGDAAGCAARAGGTTIRPSRVRERHDAETADLDQAEDDALAEPATSTSRCRPCSAR